MKFVKTAKTFSAILIVLLVLLIAYNLIVPSLLRTEGFVEGAASISDTNFKSIATLALDKNKDFQNKGASLKAAGIDKVAAALVSQGVSTNRDDAQEVAKNLSAKQKSTLYSKATISAVQ
jgi:hypothetical protein